MNKQFTRIYFMINLKLFKTITFLLFGLCTIQAAISQSKNTIAQEKGGFVLVEAENFSSQNHTAIRQWYVNSLTDIANVGEDADESHAENASGNAYIEILPDTRQTHGDKLISGENFVDKPGTVAVLSYKVNFQTPGRYYVWAKAFSTGTEDNGVHVGINGTWPESGKRMQWCEGKKSWFWESKQRTQEVHCGVPYLIYLDVEKPGTFDKLTGGKGHI